MGSVTINSNIAALNAQRRLGQSTSSLSTSFTRLSSGLRINKASDDAAGLAIAASLEVDRRVFNQGVRNLNDGVSLLRIADSSLQELSTIAVRLTELAEQSGNGTLSNKQRKALNEEAQALNDEYSRITRSTEFNGLRLFDGSVGSLRLQVGFGESGAITDGLGGAIGDGEFENPVTIASGLNHSDVSTGDFNGDGFLDVVTSDFSTDTVSVLLAKGDGSFKAGVSMSVGDQPIGNIATDLNNDGILDIAVSGETSVHVLLGNGDGSFSNSSSFTAITGSIHDTVSGDFNNDGHKDLITANYDDGTLSLLLGAGNGQFGPASVFWPGVDGPTGLDVGDLDKDGNLDLAVADTYDGKFSILHGQGDGSFTRTVYDLEKNIRAVKFGDLNNDGNLDLLAANSTDNLLMAYLGQGDGSFGGPLNFDVGGNPTSISVNDFNGDGFIDVVLADTSDDALHVLIGNGDGSFKTSTTYDVGNNPISVVSGDFDSDGVVDLLSADALSNALSILIGTSVDGVSPLLEFSLATQADARQALPLFQQKLDQLASQRGQIGAFEVRLGAAMNTTQVASENYSAAKTQIVDSDISVESARLVKSEILQQAGVAVLAQANQAPALALALLGQ